jgi:hypothetical protein
MKIIDQKGKLIVREGEITCDRMVAERIVNKLINDSDDTGADSADLAVTSSAHLILENPTGDQTKLAFTFGGTSLGGIRSDLAGNLSYHCSGTHYFWNALDSTNVGMLIKNGRVAIGDPEMTPSEMLEISNGAIMMDAILSPDPTTGGAKLFGKSISGTVEMFAADDAGNEMQISAHAMDGPAWLYDADDPFPRVVRDVNLFLGIVRYTNESRLAKLQETLLSGGSLSGLTADQKKIVHQETFEQHNARLGSEEPLVRKN